jgi:pantoate--beta-alanine ligase
MTMPRVVTTAREMREIVWRARCDGLRVGVVPTMGALHAGHISLVDTSKKACDVTVATIFVNPTQFGPNEDFARYPRTLDADLELLAAARADYVFAPTNDEMYPGGATTMIEVGGVDQPWEGECRPGHFRGVATVVLKLLECVPAQQAFFGQKDYQQSLVVRRMVADLCLPVKIVVCPIVRENDGLALSSRNRYLSNEDRARALALSRGLRAAETLFGSGERESAVLLEAMQAEIAPNVDRLEYIALADAETLAAVTRIDRPAVALVAAFVGTTRLIDNALLPPPRM